MRHEPVCPVCQSKTARLLFKRFQRNYLVCQQCGLKYVFPFPSVREIKKFYQDKFWQQKSHRGKKISGYLSYLKEKDSFLTYFQSILAQSERLNRSKAGRALDVGCGYGFFLEVARKVGWQIYGLDLSAKAVKEAKKALKVKTISNKPLEKAGFKANFFDLVTCFQTIEHLTEPDKFLKEVIKVLRPGGAVLLTTPDAGGWQAKAMGERWFSYRHPDHLLFFNFQSLKQLLNQTGFIKIKKLKDPPRYYSLSYLLEILPYYHRIKVLTRLTKAVRRAISPLGRIKIPLPLGSLVIAAEKK